MAEAIDHFVDPGEFTFSREKVDQSTADARDRYARYASIAKRNQETLYSVKPFEFNAAMSPTMPISDVSAHHMIQLVQTALTTDRQDHNAEYYSKTVWAGVAKLAEQMANEIYAKCSGQHLLTMQIYLRHLSAVVFGQENMMASMREWLGAVVMTPLVMQVTERLAIKALADPDKFRQRQFKNDWLNSQGETRGCQEMLGITLTNHEVRNNTRSYLDKSEQINNFNPIHTITANVIRVENALRKSKIMQDNKIDDNEQRKLEEIARVYWELFTSYADIDMSSATIPIDLNTFGVPARGRRPTHYVLFDRPDHPGERFLFHSHIHIVPSEEYDAAINREQFLFKARESSMATTSLTRNSFYLRLTHTGKITMLTPVGGSLPALLGKLGSARLEASLLALLAKAAVAEYSLDPNLVRTPGELRSNPKDWRSYNPRTLLTQIPRQRVVAAMSAGHGERKERTEDSPREIKGHTVLLPSGWLPRLETYTKCRTESRLGLSVIVFDKNQKTANGQIPECHNESIIFRDVPDHQEAYRAMRLRLIELSAEFSGDQYIIRAQSYRARNIEES